MLESNKIMKCQKCGADIADGKLYCENCGNEICIVPDFEPEVEQTMHQSMENILNTVFGYEERKHPEPENHTVNGMARKGASVIKSYHAREKHYFRWIVLVLIFSIMVLALVFGYMNYTADYQIRRGNYFLELEDYEGAIKHYEKAEMLDPENAEISLYLAACFETLDRMPGYEACLTKVIQN